MSSFKAGTFLYNPPWGERERAEEGEKNPVSKCENPLCGKPLARKKPKTGGPT